jgi:hypothetical protein
VNPASSQVHDERSLTLVDGGEDLQNLPLHPLTQPERGLDVIFAIDSSADTLEANGDPNWPNGTALVATYARSLLPIANGTSFPAVPDANSFVNLGLNNRPTFFGCDAENTTTPTPLIVYIPNAPYAYHSNVSTFKMEYSSTERNNIIQNGYDVGMYNVSQGVLQLDRDRFKADVSFLSFSYHGQRDQRSAMEHLCRLCHPPSQFRQNPNSCPRRLRRLLQTVLLEWYSRRVRGHLQPQDETPAVGRR